MKHLHIISRSKAKELGMARYFTGKPCARGGYGERYTSIKCCLCGLCGAAKRALDAALYATDRETRVAAMRKWRTDNRETILAAESAKRAANRDAFQAKNRNWYYKNRAARLEWNRQWWAKNTEKKRELSAAYRARKLHRIPSWFGEFDRFVFKEAVSLAKLRGASTGVRWDTDHMIPLCGEFTSGLHCGQNIQVIPAFLNQSKKNRPCLTAPDEWLRAVATRPRSIEV